MIYGYAPDAESAIAKAIEEFKITDPQKQRRLIAQLQRRGDALQTMAEESELIDLYGQDHVQAMMAAAADDKAAKPDRKLISQRLSSVEAERIEYVWPDRLAAGKLTPIAGKPGVGKSNWVCFTAATVTTGGAWPCNEGRSPVGT
jgi:putative DNA primase/helicase